MPVIQGNTSFYDYELSDQLAYNLKAWLEYGLLELGAYTNVHLSSSYATLQHDSSGIYEGLNEWIWESGVQPIDGSPLPFQVSGVYLDNTFYPLGAAMSGGITWNVDYEHGRILTNKDIPSTSTLKCEYSVRDVAIYLADSPQWKVIVDKFIERYFTAGGTYPSGLSNSYKENRLWLPCLVIDMKDSTPEGFQIGGGQLDNCSIQFHVFSDKAFSNKRLNDILLKQKDKTLRLFNLNTIPQTYNYDGTLTGSGISYPGLISNYLWTFAHFDTVTGGTILNQPSLLRSELRGSISVERLGLAFF